MNKNSFLNINDHFSPQQNLRQLSMLDEDDGVNSKSFNFSQKYVKKISMIQGWIKAKEKQTEVISETKSNIQYNRKFTRPNITTARSHYSHIAFTPKPLNMNEMQTETLVYQHIKRRPLSSTVPNHDHFDQFPSPFQPSPNRQKTHHQYLKKNCGIRQSKKSLEKDSKKKTIESVVYPMYEPTHIHNPERLVPHIGRIGYLVKLKRRHSIECRL